MYVKMCHDMFSCFSTPSLQMHLLFKTKFFSVFKLQYFFLKIQRKILIYWTYFMGSIEVFIFTTVQLEKMNSCNDHAKHTNKGGYMCIPVRTTVFRP